MESIVKKFIALQSDREKQEQFFYEEIFKRSQLKEFREELLKQIKQKSKSTYIYMLTFTLKVKDHYDKAKEYIYRQHERTQLKVISYHVVEETTKAGMPHWHVAVQTEKPLKKNRFNYYSKLYGFVDLSRTKGQTVDTVLEYMSKSNTPEQLK